jgi:hypothetical protein
MPAFDYLFRFLSAAAPELKAYLLSDNVYWSLSLQAPKGMPPYPRFSLGWLLLYRRRLASAPVEPEWSETLAEIAGIRERWRTAWTGKAGREFGVRLNQWTRFINEYRADPAAHRSRYRYEVQRRTMLALLKAEAGELPTTQLSLLDGLDAALRGSLQTGAFIQEYVFRPAFPEGEFWFLYGDLR